MPADVPTPSHDARPGAVNEMKKDGSHLERRQPDSNRGECGGKAGISVGSTICYERLLWDLEQEFACKVDFCRSSSTFGILPSAQQQRLQLTHRHAETAGLHMNRASLPLQMSRSAITPLSPSDTADDMMPCSTTPLDASQSANASSAIMRPRLDRHWHTRSYGPRSPCRDFASACGFTVSILQVSIVHLRRQCLRYRSYAICNATCHKGPVLTKP